MNLIQIAAQTAELERKIIEAEGEINDPLELILTELQTQLATKVDAYEIVMQRLNSRAESYRDYAKQFAATAKRLEVATERMKDRIKEVMAIMQTNEVQGDAFRFKLSIGVGSLVLENEELIPEKYKMVVTTTQVDKPRVKEALKAGEEVPGAVLKPTVILKTYNSAK